MLSGKTRKIKDYLIDNSKSHYLINRFLSNIMDYSVINEEMLKKTHKKNEYRGVFVDYDDSPRRGIKGTIVTGSNPIKFEYYLKRNIELSNEEGNDLIFINAWNEWGEGAMLEQTEQYGYAYLDVVKSVINCLNK